ncbi:Putative SOS response-associated peptidase YedK [Lacunisphaera limnophila]|uniref:Abasic site processing protein n=1 Tax=Lacunisphaera limnophila TaxID=1838286 RepID=A0A1D8AZG6_9BACT|nr:SOS response-associated peptidase [Lacunisphaera limnophila]AOS46254.1 Putative SOS response-associated peptidase YedK [Lacunisphaera limnophila]
MCTRYTLAASRAALAALHAVLADALAEDWTPRYNVALTQRMPVLTRRDGRATLDLLAFGLLPPPHPDRPKPAPLANARAETVLEKPTFRGAVRHRRCLVPADGFYEFEKQGRTRLPHYFTLADRRPFFFAGLWEPATDLAPASFCIVTTTPNPLVAPVHDRMPVMLGPNSGPAWLGDEPLDPARLAQLCRPLNPDLMATHRVDSAVNHVRHESPDCIAPVAGLSG